MTVFDIDQKMVDEATKKITENLKKQKIVGKEFEEKLKEELDEL